MDEMFPLSAEDLAKQLRTLRNSRRERHIRQRNAPTPRRKLNAAQRADIFLKTNGRCHICGGGITTTSWDADHVLSHNDGGTHSIDNYLPAHSLCNNYRWDYSAKELQWILKIGVWARLQMEKESLLGTAMARRFHSHELRNKSRRRKTGIGA